LVDYRGRWLTLVFYPRDFTLVCPTELIALGLRLEDFHTRQCEILAVSTDSLDAHARWLETPRSRGGIAGVRFPLASDLDAQVSRAYGVYLEELHVDLRGLFLIDPRGVLQYMSVHNLSVGRRSDDVLRILSALQSGGLCASDWSAGDPNLDPTESLVPGSIVSHYTIEDRVGTGSFGAVYRAHDLRLDRSVALKVLRPGAPHTALAEARAAAALSHPNICTIYAVDDASGVPFIAMEYLRGRSLGRILTQDAPLSAETAGAIAGQIAAGLAAAHTSGVVHGDLKPENIMITTEGVAKLLDFGLARRNMPNPDETVDYHPGSRAIAASSGIFGTPSYMAPEQTRGEPASPASDLFSLGVLVVEMLTGRKPFNAPNVLAVLDQIRSVDPESHASRLPAPFDQIVRAALQPYPQRRTLTMAGIAEMFPTTWAGSAFS
jgi:alkyl hydroperoxide reductase subunit AhpC